MRERIKDRTRLLHMLEGIDNIMEFKEGVALKHLPTINCLSSVSSTM